LLSVLQPIRRRLPLLISILLIVAVGGFSWGAYKQLEHALEGAGTARAQAAVQRLSLLLRDGVTRLGTESRRTANDTTVLKVLLRNDSAAAARLSEAFDKAANATSQLVSIALLDRDGRVLISAGDSVPADLARSKMLSALDTAAEHTIFTRLNGESGAAWFNLAVEVRRDSAPIGYLVQRRLISSDQGASQLEGLIGSEASLLFTNRGDTTWTNLLETVPGPLLDSTGANAVSYVDAKGEKRIGGTFRIAGTPWIAAVALPERVILAPARTHLDETTALALLIIAIGTVGAWLISRRITTPLAEMTAAARSMAKGDYTRRVPDGRDDELGQLARSFNSMAQQVSDATQGLEESVNERTHELQEAQSALVRREKLAILGQLSGSVGHELRNPLGVMTNAVYYLEAVLTDAPPMVQEYLGILKAQIGLSEKIIGDLLDYARIKPPQLEHVSLSALVNEQLERINVPSTTTVVTRIPADLPRAHIDRVQIGQVVLNLLTNAVQALPDRCGSITVKADREAGGSAVRLEVIDTGSGISDENLDQIFEPLFTTKARGIGLGLAVSRSLVHANRGSINVRSAVGKGTAFVVRLPTDSGSAVQ
jgi:signal transduction histidine kinase